MGLSLIIAKIRITRLSFTLKMSTGRPKTDVSYLLYRGKVERAMFGMNSMQR